MGLICFHKWILWSGPCDDVDSSIETKVCLKCWKQQQQTADGKWHNIGYINPIKDKVYMDNIKQAYYDYFIIERIC